MHLEKLEHLGCFIVILFLKDEQQFYLILLLSMRQFRYQRGFLCDVLFPALNVFLQDFAFTFNILYFCFFPLLF